MTRLNDATPEEWHRVSRQARGIGDINPTPQVPLGTTSDRNTPFVWPGADEVISELQGENNTLKAENHWREASEDELEETKAASSQVGGDWYSSQEIEPIEYTIANNLGYCEGNVCKYVTRHHLKGGAEDIRKAIHYLEFILKYEYGESS
tara:strand:+ start:4597 stop:5046 length:450 start_codon:yes stop_codon:yes gene_type:complete